MVLGVKLKLMGWCVNLIFYERIYKIKTKASFKDILYANTIDKSDLKVFKLAEDYSSHVDQQSCFIACI